jgi:hypothetical protein
LGVKRILAAYPENWYVGVAIPNLVAWAMTDPRFKRAVDALGLLEFVQKHAPAATTPAKAASG